MAWSASSKRRGRAVEPGRLDVIAYRGLNDSVEPLGLYGAGPGRGQVGAEANRSRAKGRTSMRLRPSVRSSAADEADAGRMHEAVARAGRHDQDAGLGRCRSMMKPRSGVTV